MKMGSVRAGGTPTEMVEPRSVRITGILFLNTSIKAAPGATNPRDWRATAACHLWSLCHGATMARAIPCLGAADIGARPRPG